MVPLLDSHETASYNPSHDVIRSSHLADRGGDLWGAGTGDHGLLERWLSGVDRAWIRWRDRRTVDCSSAWSA